MPPSGGKYDLTKLAQLVKAQSHRVKKYSKISPLLSKIYLPPLIKSAELSMSDSYK